MLTTLISRLLRYSLTVLIAVSVTYTTCDVLLLPFLLRSQAGLTDVGVATAQQSLASLADGRVATAGEDISGATTETPGSLVVDQEPEQRTRWNEYGRVRDVEWGRDMINWNTSTDGFQSSAGHGTYSMSVDYYLSKAFSNSLQPSKTISFFYRGKEIPQPKDITITTLVTSDRFHILAELAEQYQGGSIP